MYRIYSLLGQKFNITNFSKMVEEVLFWKFNIRKLNNKSLYRHELAHLFIYSVPSNRGLASVYKENDKLSICKENCNFLEEAKSSTWRDIKAIRYSLDLTKNLLRKKHIKWHIDNYVSSISKIKKLQKGTSKASNINF